MEFSYKHLIEPGFPSDARLWVYQCNRIFSLSEALEIESILEEFIGQWNSHGDPVKGAAHLFFGQFIVFIADESATMVSGCSTDSSVRVIKDLEKQFHVNLFDRTSLAFIIQDKVQVIPMSQLTYALENNFINPETLYFNNTVLTLGEFENSWIIPVRNSWIAKKISLNNSVS